MPAEVLPLLAARAHTQGVAGHLATEVVLLLTDRPTAPHAVQSSGIGRGGFRQSRATWPGRRHLLQSWFGQASARCASEAQRKQRMTFDWRAGLAPSVPSSK